MHVPPVMPELQVEECSPDLDLCILPLICPLPPRSLRMDEFNTEVPENKGIFPRCCSRFAQRFASCLFPHLPPAPLGISPDRLGSVFSTCGLYAGIISYVPITPLCFNQRLTRCAIKSVVHQLLNTDRWPPGWRVVRLRQICGGLKQKSQRLLCLKGGKKKN